MSAGRVSRSRPLPGDPVAALLDRLRALGSERNRAGMARFGIRVDRALGVSVTELRRVARGVGRDHGLALELWATGVHEARLLACFVDEPAAVTPAQMEAWANELDSWDLCDQAATSLFDRTPHAWGMARRWARREGEWVRRAGFALMAGLASHDRAAGDEAFVGLLPLIERGAFDERHYVKKAVSWALRGLGKRNAALHVAAIAAAERLLAAANAKAGGDRGGAPPARAARWVARDALTELRGRRPPALTPAGSPACAAGAPRACARRARGRGR
ncbi:MAG: DNA alkylation repair protein [Polyangiaceae bacterium]|nr:DNA alkylation repair protein [Polyangiaceae bacterium]